MANPRPASDFRDILRSCTFCPRLCRVDRTARKPGFCRTGPEPVVSSASAHFGEEAPLVGEGGSGTIFFTGCNLGCVFCQNYDISAGREGDEITVRELADLMLDLERKGCHNINWVTPSHQVVGIVEALDLARADGLGLPTVYNCSGYERPEIIRLLEGRVDIYMPDFKFWSAATAERYCDAPDYPEMARESIKEMHRQVGDLDIRDGLAVRGLLVRHLVMPDLVAESVAILDFLAGEISPGTYVNVMDQYRPTHRAHLYPEIDRPITRDEYRQARGHALKLGLRVSD